jgi:hypothetical protein
MPSGIDFAYIKQGKTLKKRPENNKNQEQETRHEESVEFNKILC